MANDLERFLQQAAERLAQKAGNRPPAAARPSASLPSANRNRPNPDQVEIVNAVIVDSTPQLGNLREAGDDPLSTIDTRPALAQSISRTDERMLDHVHQTFDHQLSQLKAASSSLSVPVPEATQADSAFIKMLRTPESLLAAFIASEIFKRVV